MKKAYYPQLKPASRMYYERIIGDIMEMLSQFPAEELNHPLSETYLLGYYLQRNHLYQKEEKKQEETMAHLPNGSYWTRRWGWWRGATFA